MGNLLGLSLIELLDQALHELETKVGPILPIVRDTLVAEEEADYQRFRTSDLSQRWVGVVEEGRDDAFLNLTTLFRGHSICHTAFLPSESRYKGIMMNNASLGGFPIGYFKGISREEAVQVPPLPSENAPIRLLFDSSGRQDCSLLEIDYKDYYFLTEAEGWKSWILPTRAELDIYDTEDETGVSFTLFSSIINFSPE